MLGNKRRSKLEIISMGAAMADIALLLLVFFMATTSTEPPKGVVVELPRAQTKGADQDTIYISISRTGEYYYEGRRVSLASLSDELAMRQSESDRLVAITADKELAYQKVSRLLELLKKKRFLNILFMAQPRSEL